MSSYKQRFISDVKAMMDSGEMPHMTESEVEATFDELNDRRHKYLFKKTINVFSFYFFVFFTVFLANAFFYNWVNVWK